MSSSLPIVKFINLAVRQLSQPLANRIKNRAKKSLAFRTYVCMPPAQLYHWMDENVKRKLFITFGNKKSNTTFERLNEKAAIELGAELLGEAIIFIVATITITLEFMRQQRKADREANNIQKRWDDTIGKIDSIESQIKETSKHFEEVKQLFWKQVDSKKIDKAIVSLLHQYNFSK